MTAEEKRLEKARNLRYKKPLISNMNLNYIYETIDNMQETIGDIKWFGDDIESLVEALNGDEDEAYEFKMAFSDLDAELERFRDDLQNIYVPECFDDLFAATVNPYDFGGMMGYDTYEGDYFGLDPYEYGFAAKESEKRILRATKQELLEIVGACLKVYSSFVALQYRYDCLEASIEVLRAKNIGILKVVKGIEEQYERAEKKSNHFELKYNPDVRILEKMVCELPQEYWIW